MAPRQKRRFIASAVCPGCGATDTTYVLRGDDGVSRHCTRCEFSEVAGQSPAAVWEPVRLVDPDPVDLKKPDG